MSFIPGDVVYIGTESGDQKCIVIREDGDRLWVSSFGFANAWSGDKGKFFFAEKNELAALKAQLSEAQNERADYALRIVDLERELAEAQEKLNQAHKWEELEAIETQRKLADARWEIESLKETLSFHQSMAYNEQVLLVRLSVAEGLLFDINEAVFLAHPWDRQKWSEGYSAYKASNNKQEKDA